MKVIIGEPVFIAVTYPEELTVASDALLLDHAPPETLFDKLIPEPAQTVEAPNITPGSGNCCTCINL